MHFKGKRTNFLAVKCVVQRVTHASVRIAGRVVASIGKGMLVLVGIHSSDTLSEVEGWVPKLLKLRIFADEEKPINRSVQDIDGEVLLVSQFTLYGDARGQNRPSFMQAAKPDQASPLYEAMVSRMKECWPKTASGEFGADMQVELVNDGPVTLILE